MAFARPPLLVQTAPLMYLAGERGYGVSLTGQSGLDIDSNDDGVVNAQVLEKF